MSKLLRFALLVLALCASPAFARPALMQPAADQNPQPAPDKAMVVFMRASAVGGLVAASVYDAPDSGTTFLGVVDMNTRVAAQVEPGQHRFMVIAENADFLDANLEAGKTYYVLVRPRMGVWKARFSLIPIHNRADAEYSTHSEDFKEWLSKTKYIEPTPAADAWYAKTKANIDEKKADYLVKWNKMLPEDRAVLVLHPEDGLTAQ